MSYKKIPENDRVRKELQSNRQLEGEMIPLPINADDLQFLFWITDMTKKGEQRWVKTITKYDNSSDELEVGTIELVEYSAFVPYFLDIWVELEVTIDVIPCRKHQRKRMDCDSSDTLLLLIAQDRETGKAFCVGELYSEESKPLFYLVDFIEASLDKTTLSLNTANCQPRVVVDAKTTKSDPSF